MKFISSLKISSMIRLRVCFSVNVTNDRLEGKMQDESDYLLSEKKDSGRKGTSDADVKDDDDLKQIVRKNWLLY
jgi:hypothetical protein